MAISPRAAMPNLGMSRGDAIALVRAWYAQGVPR